MRIVPLSPVPLQTLDVILDGQAAQIGLRQNGPDMYFDLRLNNEPIVTARICRVDQLLLVDAEYRGFRGQFVFVDLQGTSDPSYLGLGTRWVLVFISVAELPVLL